MLRAIAALLILLGMYLSYAFTYNAEDTPEIGLDELPIQLSSPL